MTISAEDLTPATTSGASPLFSKRDLETGLRAMGLSARQAKKLLAKGYSAYAANSDADADLLEEFEALLERLRRG